MKKLKDKALLVNVTIRAWSGRALDRKATEKTNSDHRADRSAGRYNKKLLPLAKEHQQLTVKASQIRKYILENSLPWMNEGIRILPSELYFDFNTQLNKLKNEYADLTKTFIENYDQLKVDAEKSLGDLYNANDYPSKYDLSNKFDVEITYMPVPDSKDFRIEGIDISDLDKKVIEIEKNAIKEVYSRLSEVVSKAHSRLSDHDKVFKNSLIENIRKIAELAPSLNVSEDASLNEVIEELNASICDISADQLRNNIGLRETTSKKLKAIDDKLKGAF